MQSERDERKELGVLLSRPFLAACGGILSLAGLLLILVGRVVGDKFVSLTNDIASIRSTLDSRSDLPSRTAILEQRDTDKEGRLRAVERDHWRYHGH